MKKHKVYYKLKKDLPDIKAGTPFKRIEVSLGARAFYAPIGAKITNLKNEELSIDTPVATIGNAPAHIFAQGYVENYPDWFEVVDEHIEFGICSNCETANEFFIGKDKVFVCKTCKREMKIVSVN